MKYLISALEMTKISKPEKSKFNKKMLCGTFLKYPKTSKVKIFFLGTLFYRYKLMLGYLKIFNYTL